MTRPSASAKTAHRLADAAVRGQLLAASVGSFTGIGFCPVGSGDTLIVKSGGDSRDLKRGQRMTVLSCRRIPGSAGIALVLANQDTAEQLSFEVEALGALEAEFPELRAPKGSSAVLFRRPGKATRVPSWADLGECAEALGGSSEGRPPRRPSEEPPNPSQPPKKASPP